MHPRNPYKNPPDFKELALAYSEFRQHAKQTLTGKIEIDFKDANAVRALTTVLLKKDFGLDVELPSDRLVPTLPLRLNYLLWVEDLLKTTHLIDNKASVCGVDIGTGACCIYPILAAKKFGWKFTATETDQANYICSLKTLDKNDLHSSVNLVQVTSDSLLIGNLNQDVNYDFTMCNPPFFDSDDPSPNKSRSEKRPAAMCPKAGGSSSASEIECKGGEVQFVKNLIAESRQLRSTIKIFTTMLGHKSSLAPLKITLKEVDGISSFCETEFRQGRTTRWGLAWTYEPTIQLEQMTYNHPTKSKSLALAPLNYVLNACDWQGEFAIGSIMAKVAAILHSLKMDTRKVSDGKTRKAVEFVAKENTWSNQRRRRREEQRLASDPQPEAKKSKIESPHVDSNRINEDTPAITKIDHFHLKGLILLTSTAEDRIALQIQWLEGGSGRESIHQILQYLKNRLFHSDTTSSVVSISK